MFMAKIVVTFKLEEAIYSKLREIVLVAATASTVTTRNSATEADSKLTAGEVTSEDYMDGAISPDGK